MDMDGSVSGKGVSSSRSHELSTVPKPSLSGKPFLLPRICSRHVLFLEMGVCLVKFKRN